MKIFQMLMNLIAFVNAQGEAIYYKNLIESDLDSFLALWEDKRFKRRVLGPSHPKAGAPRQDQKMRARIAAIKRRMDLFFRPESCQNPWPADSSKVMESWFSVLDYHPCAVARAQNIAQKKIAKRSESEIFFGKNCEAKRSEKKNFSAKRSEAKNFSILRKIAKNCEIAKNFSKLRKKCEELLYRLIFFISLVSIKNLSIRTRYSLCAISSSF
ncbi:unnamed protein product [Oikopleura dioica]|uniref:Uncharacterized protein n=1 Tax=Oikopleura dioica TaxID=34765 RepID=E4XWT9_OIKDI|nr:unnamed protein product [Oikopleura dioica]